MCLHWRSWKYLAEHHRVCKKCGLMQREHIEGKYCNWVFRDWQGSLQEFITDAETIKRAGKIDIIEKIFQMQEQRKALDYFTSCSESGKQ